MFILKSEFDPRIAISKISELLALADQPERIAEKLNVLPEVERVKKGIESHSFKRLLNEVDKIREYQRLETKLEEIKSGKSFLRFLGSASVEKKIEEIERKLRKFGSLLEGPRWFYKHERIWLLEAMRNYALESSLREDLEWVDSDTALIPFLIVKMFEEGDLKQAKVVLGKLDKPFRDLDPVFILKELEGQRALYFDMEKNEVIYSVLGEKAKG